MPGWLLWTTAALLLLAGVIPAAAWLLRRRHAGRLCPRCLYDMAATPGLTCSECGHVAAAEPELTGRWLRGRFPLVTVLPVIAGVSVALHAGIGRSETGWWRLAPTWLLLRVFEDGPHRRAHAALWARIDDGDPNTCIGLSDAMTTDQWRRFAEACHRITISASSSRDSRAWASVTLGCVIPDTAVVDPLIESGLRDPDCAVRERIAAAVYPYYLERGDLGERWADDLLAFACDPACTMRSSTAVNVIARIEPLRRDEVLAIVASVRGKPGAPAVWSSLAAGLVYARSEEELAARRSLLRELQDLQDADAAGPIVKALGELDQYWGPEPSPSVDSPTPP